MNLIELVRVNQVGLPEPVVPGETLVLNPGDKIHCDADFAEVASVSRKGSDLHLVLGHVTPTVFKDFFSSLGQTLQTELNFNDQRFNADTLMNQLTINIVGTDVNGVEAQYFLMPGSFIVAAAGDIFRLNIQDYSVNDCQREDDHLTIKSHGEESGVLAVIQNFFVEPAQGAHPPQLELIDPTAGLAQDKIIHPHNPIFQWQGEPLPNATVGTLYAYYFHLNAEQAAEIKLEAKSGDGELPTWLSFSYLGNGGYLLSGLPTEQSIGTQDIAISAHSRSEGVSVHTQQAFHLLVRSTEDNTSRKAADDVAAAEFRKAGELLLANSYAQGQLTIEQMPYMTMPEIATIVGLSAISQIAFQQQFSTFGTADEIASKAELDKLSNRSENLALEESRESLLEDRGLFIPGTEVQKPIVPLQGTHGVTQDWVGTPIINNVEGTETIPVASPTFDAITFSSDQSIMPLMSLMSSNFFSGLSPSQSLLPYLNLPPSGPLPLPTFFNMNNINGVNGFTMQSLTSNDYFAYNSNIIQDMNGDGFDELGIAVPFGGVTYDGQLLLVMGQTTPFPTTFDINNPSVQSTAFEPPGFSLSPYFTYGIGDFNGDGFRDMLIVGFGSEHAYIVFGNSGGFPSSVDLGILTASGGGVDITHSFGDLPFFTDGTALGDVNGDGLADVAVGNSLSEQFGFPPTYVSVYVMFGSFSPPASIDVSAFDGNNGFTIVDSTADTAIQGITFADLNGDGYNDVIFKSYAQGPTVEKVNVIFGHEGGFPSVIDVSALAVGDGLAIIDSSLSAYRAFGRKIVGLGDVNHDGNEDLLILEQFTGSAFVVFGNPLFSSMTTFDVATLDGTNGFKLSHASYLFLSGIAGIGDVNGDGIADIALADNGFYSDAGAVHIIFGSANPFPAEMDIIQTDPTIGFTIQSATDQIIITIGGGGDMNGDGLNDIVVNNYVGGTIQAANVVFGANFSGIITNIGGSVPGTIIGGTADNVIYAGTADQTIIPGPGTNFINTGVGHDIIDGTVNNGNNTLVYSPFNISVDLGSGNNTIWFQKDGFTANFITTSTTYTGIDIINLQALQELTGNHIILDATVVMNMTDSGNLTVNGTGHDSVNLNTNDSWLTSTVISGYTTYTSTSGAVVNIDNDVKVTFTPYFLSDATLDGTNGFVINPPVAYSVPSLFGQTIDIVHNLLGDGFDQLLVNAPGGGPGFSGQAFLVPGTATILPASTTIDNPALNSTLVYQGATGPFFSVADLGGFTDPGDHNLAFVISGPNAWVSLTPISSFVSPQDVNGLTVLDISNGPFNSMSVAAIGDMNGDGLTDLALFSYWTPNVYVVFGTTTPPATLDLSADLTGSNGFEITNPTVDFDFITNLNLANINGDAFTDIVYHYNDNITGNDVVTVVMGQAAAFPAVSSINTLLGSEAFRITDTAHPYSGFGSVMNDVGDFNGDGANDFAIASPDTGRVYVIFASASFSAASTFDVSSLNGTNGFTLTAAAGDSITALNFVGDMNGDGHADMAVATYNSTSGASDIVVLFGNTNSFPPTMNLVPTTDSAGFVIQHFGYVGDNAVGSITSGDFNGDGLSDIVYSNTVNLYSSSPGAVTVVFGGNFSQSITHMGTSGPDLINATGADDVVYAGAGNDTINDLGGTNLLSGGTGSDIINGGSGNDTIVFDPNDLTVDGGGGNNTLWMENDHTLADLRGTAIFTNIDVVDLHALQSKSGSQLELDPATVSSMNAGPNELTVNGGGQDSLILHNSGLDTWVSSIVIPGYTTYTASVSGAVVNAEDSLHYVSVV